jgi:hypothetical protein
MAAARLALAADALVGADAAAQAPLTGGKRPRFIDRSGIKK